MKRIEFLLFIMLLASSCAALADTRLILDGENSSIRILTYRGGLLSGLGHNHVIEARSIEGTLYLAESRTESKFALSFPVDSLVIDTPSARHAEGEEFPGTIPEDDIAKTRKNMLGRKLLFAQEFPNISIALHSLEQLPGADNSYKAYIVIDILGRSRNITVETDVEIGDNDVVISGATQVSHAELGLKAFSAALGAIKVHDNMMIKFSLVARRSDIAAQ